MPKPEFFRRLIQQALKEGVTSVTKIHRGMDGEKFKAITDSGKQFFCKIKEIGTGVTELPNQEKAILEKVSSPYVVQPVFSDIIGNRHVVIQPFIEGSDLEDKIKNEGSLTEGEVKTLASCLFNVAKELELADALHLDIKPANIIAASDGNYYLVDFGASRFLKKMRNEKIFPARRFIPPEVLSYLFNPTDLGLQQLTILSDMYGIGAVLYSAITGKDLGTYFKSSAEILNNVPEPIRSLIPGADPSLSDLIQRLISKNAADRIMPSTAIKILDGDELPEKDLPVYLFETKPKGEYRAIVPELNDQGTKCGIYWISDKDPIFGKKLFVNNLLWEQPFDDKATIESQLMRQHQFDVTALIVPGAELCNPLDTTVLGNNINSIRTAVKWKTELAVSKPLLCVIDLDESVLLSPQLKDIKNAYAAVDVDGVILRISVSSHNSTLDFRHLNAIKDFIGSWTKDERALYFDGDLSVLPLLPEGVHGLIATTYPKLNVLTHRRVKPKRANRPDGIYVPRFLTTLSTDNVTSLRGSASGKVATNCPCTACTENLTKRGKLHLWTRTERRKHFVNVFPEEVDRIKKGGSAAFKKRVLNTLVEENRFSNIEFKQAHLRAWLKFL